MQKKFSHTKGENHMHSVKTNHRYWHLCDWQRWKIKVSKNKRLLLPPLLLRSSLSQKKEDKIIYTEEQTKQQQKKIHIHNKKCIHKEKRLQLVFSTQKKEI